MNESLTHDADLLIIMANAVARMLFAQFDKDNSGSIDADEMDGLCRVLGIELEAEARKTLLRKLDTDGDGLVSFEEFVAFWEVGFNVTTLHDDAKAADVKAGNAAAAQRASALANDDDSEEARAEARRRSLTDTGSKDRPANRVRRLCCSWRTGC